MVTRNHARIELAISSSNKHKNKRYFKQFFLNKEQIESDFGNQLEWEELPDSKMSRIRFQLNDVNIFEKEDWDKINSFFVDNLPRFESAFSNVIKQLK